MFCDFNVSYLDPHCKSETSSPCLIIHFLKNICYFLKRLEHELDFVSSQQSELEEVLRPLEEPLVGAQPPDAERERIYSLAETLDAQLQRMSDDLREVIEHINSANKSQDESEPLVQISRVLNAHMVSSLYFLPRLRSGLANL